MAVLISTPSASSLLERATIVLHLELEAAVRVDAEAICEAMCRRLIEFMGSSSLGVEFTP
ncbi:hypothetical protein [Vreelandella salicampi]|uniref:Uncharacterized protein n=1 Tax=Vreelandella salicampi TaxID=1449798 RepID=A0A7Z0LP90_9GAMM|nr:hypothetical protein [Halomonas salicampi]NYS62551.1 hypothetical protein [Halomonas salicampi]